MRYYYLVEGEPDEQPLRVRLSHEHKFSSLAFMGIARAILASFRRDPRPLNAFLGDVIAAFERERFRQERWPEPVARVEINEWESAEQNLLALEEAAHPVVEVPSQPTPSSRSRRDIPPSLDSALVVSGLPWVDRVVEEVDDRARRIVVQFARAFALQYGGMISPPIAYDRLVVDDDEFVHRYGVRFEVEEMPFEVDLTFRQSRDVFDVSHPAGTLEILLVLTCGPVEISFLPTGTGESEGRDPEALAPNDLGFAEVSAAVNRALHRLSALPSMLPECWPSGRLSEVVYDEVARFRVDFNEVVRIRSSA